MLVSKWQQVEPLKADSHLIGKRGWKPLSCGELNRLENEVYWDSCVTSWLSAARTRGCWFLEVLVCKRNGN